MFVCLDDYCDIGFNVDSQNSIFHTLYGIKAVHNQNKVIRRKLWFHLMEHGIDHSESVFNQVLNDYNHDVCSMCVNLTYTDDM